MAQQGIVKKRGQHTRRRRYPGVSGPRPDQHAAKVKEAKKRQVDWASLSPSEQLVALDRRLGHGLGALKQRTRLKLKLEAQLKEQPAPTPLPVKAKQKAKDRRTADQKKGRK